MHSEWTQNLHTFINPVNTRTPTSNLPTRGGHSLVTLSSMLLTRQKRPKPLSKQKKEGFRRNPRKGPPLGNPYIYWKNQPFSLDIKAITSQWHVPGKKSVLKSKKTPAVCSTAQSLYQCILPRNLPSQFLSHSILSASFGLWIWFFQAPSILIPRSG